jgi:hypothetical protein
MSHPVPTVGASDELHLSTSQMEMRSAAQPVRGNSFTIEEALEHIGFGWTQLIMFFFVGIAWAGDGMEMMLLSYLGPEVSSQSHHYFMRAHECSFVLHDFHP